MLAHTWIQDNAIRQFLANSYTEVWSFNIKALGKLSFWTPRKVGSTNESYSILPGKYLDDAEDPHPFNDCMHDYGFMCAVNAEMEKCFCWWAARKLWVEGLSSRCEIYFDCFNWGGIGDWS